MKLVLDEWVVREVIDTLHTARTTLLGITGLDSPQEVAKKSSKETAITRRISKAIDIIQQSEKPDNKEKLMNFFDAVGDCGFSQHDILLLKNIWKEAGCPTPKPQVADASKMEQQEPVKGKFVFPKYLYARTKDNKTIDMSYAPQDMAAVEHVRNDFVEQEQPEGSGVELIAAERKRQIESEGYSIKHDLEHDARNLICAALTYIKSSDLSLYSETLTSKPDDNWYETYRKLVQCGWPFDPRSFKPTTPLRDLVKAGALIAAAIDRLKARKEE